MYEMYDMRLSFSSFLAISVDDGDGLNLFLPTNEGETSMCVCRRWADEWDQVPVKL